MSYQESFEKLKKLADSLKAENVEGHYAYQFDIIGEDEGSFYVEIADGKIVCEPYDYKDNNAVISASSEELAKYFSGEIAVLTVNGFDADVLWDVITSSNAKKDAKPAEKKTVAKPKTEKVTKSAPAAKRSKSSCRVSSKTTAPVADTKAAAKPAEKATAKTTETKKTASKK